MKDFQQRVIDERIELDKKREKLEAFFHTDTFNSLSRNEQLLLQRQYAIMTIYSQTLEKRIELFF